MLGKLEIIVGPMFSGKSEELIRRIKRAKLANRKVACYKSNIDKRYSVNEIVSHDNRRQKSKTLSSLKEILSETADFIAVDEIQFFPESELEILVQLANSGKTIIVAGLDMDYTGAAFPSTAKAMAMADEVLKLKAICMECGEEAGFSKRLSTQTDTILVGEKQHYQARCRKHFYR
ncbi:MAG: thymidine kinase [Luteibaculum sp.]